MAVLPDEAVVIFEPSVTKKISSSESRLPANYVGISVVRPNIIASKKKSGPSNQPSSSTVKFVVADENGKERRMTSAEKKAKKLELLQEKKEARQRQKLEQSEKRASPNFFEETGDSAVEEDPADAECASEETKISKTNQESLNGTEPSMSATQATSYHQMPLNEAVMEEEKEERSKSNMVPAILSPPMALQFYCAKQQIECTTNNVAKAFLSYNHALSLQWAEQLHQLRVLPAEELRRHEDLRPLAYTLKPEPWQRLRPSLESNPIPTLLRQSSTDNKSEEHSQIPRGEAIPIPESRPWISLTCRPPLSSPTTARTLSHDHVLSIVFEYLHRETPYYVSCGAKFGSDFLIYDGPREERHAFAGLRVLSPTRKTPDGDSDNGDFSSIQLPLPTAYALTSYVRCLNTAGKLTLLATVVPSTTTEPDDRPNYQVLVVDVALEKVLDAPTHKRKRNRSQQQQQKRKDITKNLAKT